MTNERMLPAAVRIADHGLRALEDGLILRPTLGDQHDIERQPALFIERSHQECTARAKLMLAAGMALHPGDEDYFCLGLRLGKSFGGAWQHGSCHEQGQRDAEEGNACH